MHYLPARLCSSNFAKNIVFPTTGVKHLDTQKDIDYFAPRKAKYYMDGAVDTAKLDSKE